MTCALHPLRSHSALPLLLAGALVACGGEGPLTPDASPPELPATDGGTPPPDGAVPLPEGCRSGEVERFGACVPEPEGCDAGTPCQNDSCCLDNECIPFGVGACAESDPSCAIPPAPAPFVPELQCEWTGRGVMATPVVGDLNMDGDPDTQHPSIAFTTTTGANLVVIDGATCEEQHRSTLRHWASPAIVDVTGDGQSDLVVSTPENVQVLSFDGVSRRLSVVWQSPLPSGRSGISVHDLDGDGAPEVIVGGHVFSASGELLAEAGLSASTTAPVVVDVDGDGRAEHVTSNGIFELDVDARSWVLEPYWDPPEPLPGRFFAVADFGDFGDGPGVPEIVRTGGGHVSVSRIDGTAVFGPYPLPDVSSARGGPPTVADFDGDGRPEIGVADATSYSVYDLDCDPTPGLPAECDGPGRLWQQVSQDLSSGQTGSSVFDFDGDGAAEVVYGDECYLRVYDGTTGRVRFSVANNSMTAAEYPIVADVDGDGGSEIVSVRNAASSRNCSEPHDPTFHGGVCRSDLDCASPLHRCVGGACRAPRQSGEGIRVFRDRSNQWMPSRPIWSQYEYHVTHIRDDGSVPGTSEWLRNWEQPDLNNYRQNAQGLLEGLGVPDVTLRPESGWDCVSVDAQRFVASVCNRGGGPAAVGLGVVFEAGGASICPTARTSRALAPGECAPVECLWTDAPHEPVTVEARVEADASRLECDDANNRARFLIDPNACVLM